MIRRSYRIESILNALELPAVNARGSLARHQVIAGIQLDLLGKFCVRINRRLRFRLIRRCRSFLLLLCRYGRLILFDNVRYGIRIFRFDYRIHGFFRQFL